MHRRRLLPILERCPSLARAVFLIAFCVAGSSLLAQSHRHASPSPSPSPTATPTPPEVTPDQLGLPPAASPAPSPLPDPVAIVDGEPIHPKDLERVAAALLSANGRNLSELSDADRRKALRSVLDDMITDKLVARHSADEKVADVDVEKRFNDIRTQYGANFEAEVKKSGQTPDQIRHNIHTQIAQQEWIEQQIAPDIKVSPQEVEKFYKESPPNRFDAPEMVRASHILVAVRRDAPPEDVMAAETKINDLAARVKKGESFEALAKQYSDDPNAKETAGDLDYFSRERIMPEFADAAFKLKVGEVSAPVQTQFGFHLIKLTDRKPAHVATLDEARDQIATYLQDEKRRVAIMKVIQNLKDNAKIQIFLN
jgi:peptidyl-prolyl cis-trans isomerase C